MAQQNLIWTPHPGPQQDFLAASEFEVLYGGAAGGGKSDAGLYGGLRNTKYPTYRGLFLRRTYPELKEMIERSSVFSQMGAKWNETKKEWRWPNGAVYEFGYFDIWKHHVRYQGQEYQYVVWDELGTVPEERFWVFLMSRLRTKDNRIRSVMRATANPGGAGHGWLMRRFINPCGYQGERIYQDPDSGLTRRFIPAKVADNHTLMEKDPGYVNRLKMLNERARQQLLEGRWDVAMGLALNELDEEVHWIRKDDPDYVVQPYWTFFGAFDWGFQHPAAIGIFAVKPNGQVILVDSLHLWQKTPTQQADRVRDKLAQIGRENNFGHDLRVPVFFASHDCWNENKSRGENTPTIAETFRQQGLTLVKANQSRVSGLNNMREFITTIGPERFGVPTTRAPMFRVRDTPGNRRTWDCLTTMVVDEKDAEDALKRDADPDTGEGGDDPYDMVRYGLASRMPSSTEPDEEIDYTNFDKQYQKIMKDTAKALKIGRYKPWK